MHVYEYMQGNQFTTGVVSFITPIFFHMSFNYFLCCIFYSRIINELDTIAKSVILLIMLFIQYFIISETIDVLVHTVYIKTNFLNHNKRPQKTISRLRGYTTLANRWLLPYILFCLYVYFSKGYMYKQNHNIEILGIIKITPPSFTYTSIYDLTKYYCYLGTLIQMSLIFGDLLYGGYHHLQHTYKFLYRLTEHGYHHKFRYPLAREGTWLGWIDTWLGLSTIGIINVILAILIVGRGQCSMFDYLMILSYVNEMNACDHCGKKMNFHSGVPFLPCLSIYLGFDKSVEAHEAHEAHHNMNKYSYGLLGLYDYLAGTLKYAE
jgi:hypothetical protein